MPAKPEREFRYLHGSHQPSVEARAAFLDRACTGNQELRLNVEALLRANDGDGGFLDRALARAEGEMSMGSWEKPGDQVERYKLIKQIGEGGCGVVFEAEQSTPVSRRVALKVVKPGMDTKA